MELKSDWLFIAKSMAIENGVFALMVSYGIFIEAIDKPEYDY